MNNKVRWKYLKAERLRNLELLPVRPVILITKRLCFVWPIFRGFIVTAHVFFWVDFFSSIRLENVFYIISDNIQILFNDYHERIRKQPEKDQKWWLYCQMQLVFRSCILYNKSFFTNTVFANFASNYNLFFVFGKIGHKSWSLIVRYELFYVQQKYVLISWPFYDSNVPLPRCTV